MTRGVSFLRLFPVPFPYLEKLREANLQLSRKLFPDINVYEAKFYRISEVSAKRDRYHAQ